MKDYEIEWDDVAYVRDRPELWQKFIDALVEAGVLEPEQYVYAETSEPMSTFYKVVQPHVHEWSLLNPDGQNEVYIGRTRGCGEKRIALPLPVVKVPK